MRVLASVAATGNTHRSAEQLNLSQSAVSRALGKLREVLEDPLFVRAPHGLEPTDYTRRLVAALPEVFDQLSEIVEGDESFDPGQWQGSVTLALSSVVFHCWGQDIYEQLSSQAPQVVWNLQNWRSQSGEDILSGRVALGVHFKNSVGPRRFISRPSWTRTTYCSLGKDMHCRGSCSICP